MIAAPDPALRAMARLLIVRRSMSSAALTQQCAVIRAIVSEVAWHEGVRRTDILGRRRDGRFVRARAAVVWVARKLGVGSTTKIGVALGRDHSTVLTALSKAEILRQRDEAFKRLTDRIRDHFRDLQED
ncbi:MAG: helix-turn-helix domain-containing protein [Sphingobium limneticum]